METNCKECPFKGQTQVYGEGSTILEIVKEIVPTTDPKITFKRDVEIRDNESQYDVVIVGMAPAREETRQGRPMVGASGQILRRTLEQMEVKDFYICNVFLCPITEDELVPQALKCCRDVMEEIRARKPKLTIALGDLPLHTLADTPYSIREIEGRVIPSKVGPLLPITHPAFYWRHPSEFFDFIECMRSGIKFLKGTYQQAGEPTSSLVTYQNLNEVRNELDKHDELAVDLETTGFFAYGWEPNEVLEMGISGDHNHAYIVPKQLIPEFKELLEKKKGIYWNAQFDCAFLKQFGINAYAYFDGMLAHYSIDERGYGHGLKKVARTYLGCDDWEKEIDKYIPKRQKKTISYSVIPTDVRHTYLSKDVTRTFQLKEVLEDEVNKKVFWELLMPATRMFIDIECRGMQIDPVLLMEMDKILEEDLDKLDRELRDLTGAWLNPNSPKQVSDLLYRQMGLPIDPYFGMSTGAAVLEPFKENPIVAAILDYRTTSKMKGTYIEGFARFVDRQYRIHPQINLFKAVTGRLSSSNPSIMNIKRDSRLREIFLPDIGNILGNFDIKMNELKWYYVISRDEELGALLKRTPTEEEPYANDPHHIVSEIAYGKERAREMRVYAKAVVFGRLYERTRKSIEYQVGSEVIDRLMETVDGIFPGVGDYGKGIMKQVREKGYLESYFGRKRRFGLITPETAKTIEREAVNFPIQSAGSDLMLTNFLHLWEIKDKLGIWPFWPIHDSITLNAPNVKVLSEVKKELEAFSLDVVKGIIPFEWEADWGYNWGEKRKLDES